MGTPLRGPHSPRSRGFEINQPRGVLKTEAPDISEAHPHTGHHPPRLSHRARPQDGIAPGAAGWVTLHLDPGRYELICNLPGHYAAGMYAELDVT